MPDSPTFRWPDGATSAVSLTFDDGVPSHVSTVIPILDEYGFRGTFYVTTAEGGPLDQRLDAWRAAARTGHEIGNHSVSHPCSRNLWVSAAPRKNLDDMTLDDIRGEILAANRRIAEKIPGQRAHSFAYPCGETHIGRGATHTSYVPVVAELCPAARGLGDGVVSNDPAEVDLASVWAIMPVEQPGEWLVKMAEPAAAQGKWTVFAFHGVGGDHLVTSVPAFRTLLDYLAANRGRIWTDTFVSAGTWVRDHRAR